MITFQRIFQTRQQAMDVYRTQLSHKLLYVESFEGHPQGTAVSVVLEIQETRQRITLQGSVDRMIGRNEVVELGYGMRPGLLLHIPITADIVEPLRAFFLAQGAAQPSTNAAEPPAANTAAPAAAAPATVRPTIVRPTVVRPSGLTNAVPPARPSGLTNAVPPARPSGLTNAVPPARPSGSSLRPAAAAVKPGEIPLANLNKCSHDQALAQIQNFIAIAERGSLYDFFGVTPDVDRKTLRSVYNSVVRILHPDSHAIENAELSDKLGEAYQVFNEAYRILQHPIQSTIYFEVSKGGRAAGSMSLEAFKKWQADYALRNAQNIRLAEDLVAKAQKATADGNKAEAAEHLRLALQYDPYNEHAREMTQGDKP